MRNLDNKCEWSNYGAGRGVDPYGTGRHVPPIFGLGDIITNVPPIILE